MKIDVRIQKTHGALIQSMTELLGEKTFEDIAVSELCDRAMVRRSTFYKHFGDKYEFFAFMVQSIQQRYKDGHVTDKEYSQPHQYYVDVIENFLDFFSQHDALIRSILRSSMLPALMDILSERIVWDVLERLKLDNPNNSSAAVELLAQVFTGSLLSVSKWWLLQPHPMPKEQLVDELSQLVRVFI